MRKRVSRMSGVLVVLLLGLLPAAGQVTVGDNTKLNLSGDLSTGYSGGFSNIDRSSHSLDLGGNASLNGSYYNPQFISFALQPYYNRSQANSSYQSITNSSGLIGSANFFGGSHIPGSISFSKTWDSTGQFGIPGVNGLDTNGSGQTFNISWGELFADWPTLQASYTVSGQNTSVPGAEGTDHFGSRILSLNSDYTLEGFRLRGFLNRLSNSSEFPAFLTGGQTAVLNGTSTSYGAAVWHSIPLHGYWSGTVSRTGFTSDSGSGSVTGSSDGSNTTLSTSVTLNPVSKLGLGFGADYQTNLFGAVQQQILQVGGVAPLRSSESGGSATSVNGSASYTISRFVYLNAQFNHREQSFDGQTQSITQYGGGLSFNFARRFLGALSFSVGANDTATQEGNSGAGLYTNVNFSRKIHGWDVGSNFSYVQSLQTLFALYTTSSYGYGASLRRRFKNELYWGAIVNASHSGLVQVEGSTNHSETFSTFLSFRRYSLNGLYSQSGGISVLTAQGLVVVPAGVPSPLLANTMLFNARSYGGGIATTLRRFELSMNYSKAVSQTSSTSNFSNNGTTLMNARVRYRLRRLYLDSGFLRFNQSIGVVGSQPSMVNSYYVGISRWFNVF